MAEHTALLDAVQEYDETLKNEYAIEDDERQRMVGDFVHELLDDEQQGQGRKIE